MRAVDAQVTRRQDRIRQTSAARRARQRDAVRRTLLKAAEVLLRQYGYEGFSLRAVAERAGYTPTTVYLYFKDRDDLVFEVVCEGFKRFDIALREASTRARDPWQRLIEIGRAYIAFGLSHPMHYRLMFMQRPAFLTRQRPNNQQSVMETFDLVVQAVAHAIDAGVLKPGDAQRYSYTFWAGVHGIVALALSAPDWKRSTAWELADVFFPMSLDGLRAR
jgi:AcrR family transcriptional regulator